MTSQSEIVPYHYTYRSGGTNDDPCWIISCTGEVYDINSAHRGYICPTEFSCGIYYVSCKACIATTRYKMDEAKLHLVFDGSVDSWCADVRGY